MNTYDGKKEKYADIFNARGSDYHKAMVLLPNARDNEFKKLIEEIHMFPDMTIVDIPSGGNYLKNYLPETINVIPLETSEIFAHLGNTKVCTWSSLPLKDNSVDAILCCAAFHHVAQEDRLKFRAEVERSLKPEGKLIIADVQKDSSIDYYLNGFVNDYNSMGHTGWFLEDGFGPDFASKSLILDRDTIKEFPWYFSKDLNQSLEYMKLLFGIDKATHEDIHDYLSKHLEFSKEPNGNYKMNWMMRYVTFVKR